jgi:hypothetical protein
MSRGRNKLQKVVKSQDYGILSAILDFVWRKERNGCEFIFLGALAECLAARKKRWGQRLRATNAVQAISL